MTMSRAGDPAARRAAARVLATPFTAPWSVVIQFHTPEVAALLADSQGRLHYLLMVVINKSWSMAPTSCCAAAAAWSASCLTMRTQPREAEQPACR
jgi:hypothetical protein